MTWFPTLTRALVLLGAGAAVGFAVNAVRPNGVRPGSFEPKTSCEGVGSGAEQPSSAPREITPKQAARLCGRPDVVVADTRPLARFTLGHVAGAMHLPCDATGEVASPMLTRLEQASTVIVYGESTEDAQPVAEALRRRAKGPLIQVLTGGFAAWERAALACESGSTDDTASASKP